MARCMGWWLRPRLLYLLAFAVVGSTSAATALARAANRDQALDGYTTVRTYNRRGRPTTELRGPTAEVSVDRVSGMLVELVNRAPEPPQTPGRLSTDDARQVALRFLARWRIELGPQWNRERMPIHVHGGDYADYGFVWEQCLEGVYLPAWCSVTLDAHTGYVRTYSLCQDPVTVPLAWRVSGDQAIAAVGRLRGWSAWKLEYLQLHVGYRSDYFDEKNRVLQSVGQAVLWHVKLWGPAGPSRQDDWRRFADVEVDAVTGQIAREYRYSGQPRRPDRKVFEQAKNLLARAPKPNPDHPLAPPPTIFETVKAMKAAK